VGAIRIVSEVIDAASPDELIKIAGALTRSDESMVVVLGMEDKKTRAAAITIMAGSTAVKAGIDCGQLAALAASVLGGGGGGKPEMGQGGGPNVEKLEDALKSAVVKAREVLGGRQR
jgi:alanyl-tRNA synthetase